MSKKTFTVYKLVTAIILGAVASISISLNNWYLLVIFMALALAFLFILKKKVKEVIADERDYETGGKAARLAIQIFSYLAVALMLVFYAYKEVNPFYEGIALTLAYSVCFLLIVYTLIFRFYDNIIFLKKKPFYVFLGILAILIAAVLGIRILSGEDDWICRNGEWVKHGNPSFPAPLVECKR